MVARSWPTRSSALAESRRRTLDAYDYVQLAAAAFRTDKESMAEVRALLEKAIALDPSYPRAYYQLAWAHFKEALNGYSDDPARSLEQFHAAAEKMVALDPMDPTRRSSLVCPTSSAASGRAARRRGSVRWRWPPTIPASSGTSAPIWPTGWDGASGGGRGADQAGAAAQPARAGLAR